MTPPPELIEAARLAPHDDAPRLAIADWLDEHGDAEWAEFIRVQCALARPDPLRDKAQEDAMRQREAELVARMDARAGVSPPLTGFVSFLWSHLWSRGWLRAVHRHEINRETDYLALAQHLEFATEQGAPAVAEWLSGLSNLTTAVVRLGGDPPAEWAEVEPLARLWGVTQFHLEGPGGELDGWLTGRLEAEWQRRAESATPAECLRAAQSLCGHVHIGAGVWAHLDPFGLAAFKQQPWDVVGGYRWIELREQIFWTASRFARRDAVLSLLPGLRGLVGRPAEQWGHLAALPGVVAAHGVPTEAPLGPGLRELVPLRLSPLSSLANVGTLPRLRVLDARAFGALDAAALGSIARCAKLRVLRLGPVEAADFAGLLFARVLDLTLGGEEPDADTLRQAFPALRFLNGRSLDDEWPVAVVPGGRLAVPPWFERLPTAAPDPARPDVEPLAAWREWGGAADDELLYGPVRLRIERLPAVEPGGEARTLAAVPTPYPAAEWGRVRTYRRRFDLESTDALGWQTYRALWPLRDGALRLVCDYPSRRPALPLLVRRIAESLQLARVGT